MKSGHPTRPPASMNRRFSLLTASFGEGHNTAARNVRDALYAVGGNNISAEICDLYQHTNPRLNRAMQSAYTAAINRFPMLWKGIFHLLAVPGLLEATLPALSALREAMREHFRAFQPDVIVSTYPVYSFLVRQIRKTSPFLRSPLVTIVTDSTRINSAWHRCPSDAYIVADEPTREVLARAGVPKERLHVLGFPVSLRFEELKPLSPNDAKPPFRILFMPSTRRGLAVRSVAALLSLPEVGLTVCTGRHQALHKALTAAGFNATPHVRLIGWTDQMPELLASHHLFIGKAGGAIVQEALAAQTPFLVSHLVPGQEEGNIALLQQLAVGSLATGGPDALAAAVRQLFKNHAALWREWKHRLAAISKPDASRKIADFLIHFPSLNSARH